MCNNFQGRKDLYYDRGKKIKSCLVQSRGWKVVESDENLVNKPPR